MADQETTELRWVGDGLQSAASRMAEWIRKGDHILPYEVRMAVLEAEDYIDQWTCVRTGYAVTKGQQADTPRYICESCGGLNGETPGRSCTTPGFHHPHPSWAPTEEADNA